MKEVVVLLHGIWMRPVVMSALGSFLRDQGYTVLQPGYASLRKTPVENAASLCQQLPALLAAPASANKFHFVCHSLGGLVALHLLQHCQELLSGRLVTLGTPVQGSMIAQRISHWPVVDSMLGESLENGLAGMELPDSLPCEWGAIAGNKALGVGSVLGGFQGQGNDGTVTVSETRSELQNEHLTLPVNHTGLLFSRVVFEQVACFLQDGKFCR
ncbi:MAG: esterase/lipase family protein [Thiolinea sp.]